MRKHNISKLHYITYDVQLIEAACKAGADWIQLRIKNAGREEIKKQAILAKEICKNYNATLLINDHPDIAHEIDADGVHLGKEDMHPSEARKLLGDKFIIGATANSLKDINRAIEAGADYIGLGPFRFTTTKEKLSPVLGLSGYTELISELKNTGSKLPPIIAIGGIKIEDTTSLMQTGIYGIAVSGEISNSQNKLKTISEFKNHLYASEEKAKL